MYILILAIFAGTGVSTTSIEFDSEVKCLQALSDIIVFEKNINGKVKAKCVKK